MVNFSRLEIGVKPQQEQMAEDGIRILADWKLASNRNFVGAVVVVSVDFSRLEIGVKPQLSQSAPMMRPNFSRLEIGVKPQHY